MQLCMCSRTLTHEDLCPCLHCALILHCTLVYIAPLFYNAPLFYVAQGGGRSADQEKETLFHVHADPVAVRPVTI